MIEEIRSDLLNEEVCNTRRVRDGSFFFLDGGILIVEFEAGRVVTDGWETKLWRNHKREEEVLSHDV